MPEVWESGSAYERYVGRWSRLVAERFTGPRYLVQIASAGLQDWPEHPSLRYQLACYEALQGHREAAIEHLRIAFEQNPDTREWAADDEDLASVRDDPTLG